MKFILLLRNLMVILEKLNCGADENRSAPTVSVIPLTFDIKE